MQANDIPLKERVFEIVRAELLRVRRAQSPDFDAEIGMESSLIADLGLDSLSLVEAVVALEEALRIEHLSIEALGERDSGNDGGRFTVGSLVDLCLEQVAPGALRRAAPSGAHPPSGRMSRSDRRVVQ